MVRCYCCRYRWCKYTPMFYYCTGLWVLSLKRWFFFLCLSHLHFFSTSIFIYLKLTPFSLYCSDFSKCFLSCFSFSGTFSSSYFSSPKDSPLGKKLQTSFLTLQISSLLSFVLAGTFFLHHCLSPQWCLNNGLPSFSTETFSPKWHAFAENGLREPVANAFCLIYTRLKPHDNSLS